MSIENDLVAVLSAYAPLTALVGNRISQHAVDPNDSLPVVVWNSSSDPLDGLDGDGQIEQSTITLECWATTAVGAAAVADQVAAALDAYDATHGTESVDVTSRQGAHDPELGLDGEVVTVQWMRL